MLKGLQPWSPRVALKTIMARRGLWYRENISRGIEFVGYRSSAEGADHESFFLHWHFRRRWRGSLCTECFVLSKSLMNPAVIAMISDVTGKTDLIYTQMIRLPLLNQISPQRPAHIPPYLDTPNKPGYARIPTTFISSQADRRTSSTNPNPNPNPNPQLHT